MPFGRVAGRPRSATGTVVRADPGSPTATSPSSAPAASSIAERVGVEAGTQFGDRGRVLDGHLERRTGFSSPGREQRAGLGFLDLERRGIERQLERREWIDLLALYRQRFAAGRQDRELRRLSIRRADEGGYRSQEVLAVVQHQQQVLVTEERGETVSQ